jgi:hypothetical protein
VAGAGALHVAAFLSQVPQVRFQGGVERRQAELELEQMPQSSDPSHSHETLLETWMVLEYCDRCVCQHT